MCIVKGQFVKRFEFESVLEGKGTRRIPWRSGSSNLASLHMFKGDIIVVNLCLPEATSVTINDLIYSNDGESDRLEVFLDDANVGIVNTEANSGGLGTFWDIFKSSGQVAVSQDLFPGKHTVAISVTEGDCYGSEFDALEISLSVNVSEGHLWCGSELKYAEKPTPCAENIDKPEVLKTSHPPSPATKEPTVTTGARTSTTAAPQPTTQTRSSTRGTSTPTTHASRPTTSAPSLTIQARSSTTPTPSSITQAPSTTTTARSPTTSKPSLTTQARSSTTSTLIPTTSAPSPRTQARSSTTQVPSPTTQARSSTTPSPTTQEPSSTRAPQQTSLERKPTKQAPRPTTTTPLAIAETTDTQTEAIPVPDTINSLVLRQHAKTIQTLTLNSTHPFSEIRKSLQEK
ncbi:mucin-2-like [Mya arenaria]|uniref:mucin-2-like n=1 Tax=Mya arenaria TaxID=6604 RepID=UPI0022E8B4B5|nr:mucin-2-like [Mya arenaria]